MNSKQLVCDFKGHKYGVQCCAISSDEKLVLSADISSTVLVSSYNFNFKLRIIKVLISN